MNGLLDAILDAEDVCTCGHERSDHFEGYAECRGGYGCDEDCREFEKAELKPEPVGEICKYCAAFPNAEHYPDCTRPEPMVDTPSLIEGLQSDLFCLICGYNIRITIFTPDNNQRASCDKCNPKVS